GVLGKPEPTGLIQSRLGQSTWDQPNPTHPPPPPTNECSNKPDIILDSFAGSGTTAHAVLALNKADGGNRRFILVECEDYADSITAERVRRVIAGIPASKNKAVQMGTGGSFLYCTLGQPLDIDSLLQGDSLPAFGQLASYLLHTASGISTAPDSLPDSNADGFFYFDEQRDYYLIYQPRRDFLRSGDAALNLERAERIHAKGRKATVFAAAKYISQRQLSQWDITFCQLPYALLGLSSGR
ncbi:MAG: DNA methyltransferase, partial [Chloroflexota bacterium]|nr:DNA methyltransferase [Chloroflexota bacterium]